VGDVRRLKVLYSLPSVLTRARPVVRGFGIARRRIICWIGSSIFVSKVPITLRWHRGPLPARLRFYEIFKPKSRVTCQ
jgi:hypothetical protein